MGSEVISVVERRRRWSTEEKLQILIAALEPGASVTAVAERHGVTRNLIYQWMRLARERRLRGLALNARTEATFVPVQVAPEPVPSSPAVAAPVLPPPEPARSMAPHRRRSVSVEITLANGRVLKVDEGIDASALARIVAALDGGGA